MALQIVDDFIAEADPTYSNFVRRAMDAAKYVSPSASGRAFGVATATYPIKEATYPIKEAAGKRVRFSGYIKTENVTTGYAGLWWRVDGPSGVLAFDNMQYRGVAGTTDWKRYSIELSVAPEARNINFGALLTGNGTAWFDALTIELDGIPYTEDKTFDLDFESSSPKGFYTGGDGYQVQLDSGVFRRGTQSLRMTKSPVSNLNAVSPVTASSIWREVVGPMKSSLEAYQKKGFTPEKIEWAIQNARVVLQCMQLQARETSRDDSMAANVKWILDNNPGAKIVLWAHNGHVSTASVGGHGAMGASLRQMFGSQWSSSVSRSIRGHFRQWNEGKGCATSPYRLRLKAVLMQHSQQSESLFLRLI